MNFRSEIPEKRNANRVRLIKKSSNLIDTYVPGIGNNGNFGYKGIAKIKEAIRYFLSDSSFEKCFCIN